MYWTISKHVICNTIQSRFESRQVLFWILYIEFRDPLPEHEKNMGLFAAQSLAWPFVFNNILGLNQGHRILLEGLGSGGENRTKATKTIIWSIGSVTECPSRS